MLYPWVAHVAFPFYHRLNYFTVYEYLEARFDVRVRTLAAMIFILWRVGWMATAMYVPSLAINAATGGQVDLNTMTIIVGVLVTLYTMLGGIQAVIWNDVVQFCIMFGGLAATVVIVWSTVPGGMSEIWTVNAAAGKFDWWPPLVDPAATGLFAQVESFFHQPMTLVTLLVALVVGRMAQYTSDQVMVQRLQTTRSLQDARSAFIVNAAGDALWMVGLSFVGFALFAYFQRTPLPPEFATDKLVPYFMSLAFPAGAVGLVIAAIMAASLSSIDSAINSCTSVAVVDLYNRVWRGSEVRSETAQRRRRARADQGLADRHGVLRRAGHDARLQRVAHRIAARDQREGGQRLHRSAVRHLPAGDVQPPGEQRRRPRRRVASARSRRTTWPITAASASCGHRRSAWPRRSPSEPLLSAVMPMAADDARGALTWRCGHEPSKALKQHRLEL